MAVSLSLQDVMNEGDVVAISQWDFSVTELVLQAVVEEAEQELVGQTGGAVYLLVILHCCSHTHDNTEYLCFFSLFQDGCTLFSLLQMEFRSTVPVLNVRKKSSTCWHFGSS